MKYVYRSCVVLLALFCLSLGTVSLAQKPQLSTPQLIEAALDAGEIDQETATLYLAYAFGNYDALPTEFKSEVPWRGTLPLLQLQQDVEKMASVDKRSEVQRILTGNCSSSSATLPNVRNSANFHVEYGTFAGGLTIDDYISALETTWDVEVTDFDWTAPPVSSNPPPGDRYHVRVDALDGGLYGYVTTGGTHAGFVGDNPNTPWTESAAFASCMVLNRDYVGFPGTPLQALQATAAHEFVHSLQFGYGALSNSVNPDSSFVEGGATWMEDEVFDTANDNYNYLWPDFDQCMGEYNASPYPYWITFRGLTEPFGTNVAGQGEDVMQIFWEQISQGTPMFPALEAGLAEKGTNLADAYHDYAIAVKFNKTCSGGYASPHCFEEGADYVSNAGTTSVHGIIGAIGNSYSNNVQNNYTLKWVSLPTGSLKYGVTLENSASAGELRASLVCDTGSTLRVESMPSLANGGESTTLTAFDPAGCDSVVAVITNQEQTSSNPSSCSAHGFILSTELAAETGTLSGRVTESGTGNPLENATIEVDGLAETTNANGEYSVSLPAGSYTVRIGKYGYQTATFNDVSIAVDSTTTQNAVLAPSEQHTLSGTVTDDVIGEPLYARITISGNPQGPPAGQDVIWTDADTGAYSIVLPAEITYTLSVTSYSYLPTQLTVPPLSVNRMVPIAMNIDSAVCDAPLYQGGSQLLLEEGFEGTDFPPAGWTVYDLDNSGLQNWEQSTQQANEGSFSARHRYGGIDDAAQDGWLVTQPITLAQNATASFSQYVQFPGDYGKHSLLICNLADGCDAPPTNFTELAEFANPTDSWVDRTATVNGFSEQTVVLALRYEGDFAATWYVDTLAVETLERCLPRFSNIELTKTVGQNPNTCASTKTLVVETEIGAPVDVTYCYKVENTGNITFTTHSLQDNQLGPLLTDFAYELGPGETVVHTETTSLLTSTANTAVWEASNTDGDTATFTDTASVTLRPVAPPEADLTVSLTAAPRPFGQQSVLTYTAVVTNTGPQTATSVVLTHTLPASVTLLSTTSAEPICSVVDDDVVCAAGSLASGDGVLVTAVVSVPLTIETFSSTVQALAAEIDPNLANNSRTLTIERRIADLAISLTEPGGTGSLGSLGSVGLPLQYAVQLSNLGPNEAESVLLSNQLPPELAFESVSPGAPTCSEVNGLIRCNFATLPMTARQAMTSVVITVTPIQSGTVTSTVRVQGANFDPNLSNNVASLVLNLVGTMPPPTPPKIYLPIIQK